MQLVILPLQNSSFNHYHKYKNFNFDLRLSMQLDKILIAIPTYNEKLNIASLSVELLSLYNDIDIIVIDDNSP